MGTEATIQVIGQGGNITIGFIDLASRFIAIYLIA